MPVPKGWNINSTISLIGFVIMIAGMVWTTAQRDADLSTLRRDFTEYRTGHEQLHKDRLAAVSATEARFDARLGVLETAIRKQDNIEYRVTVVEQGSANLARAVDELKAALNSVVTDIRVVREIVTRLDPVQR